MAEKLESLLAYAYHALDRYRRIDTVYVPLDLRAFKAASYFLYQLKGAIGHSQLGSPFPLPDARRSNDPC